MWDFITSSEFPETGEYIEKINTRENRRSNYLCREFNLNLEHTDQRGFSYPIPGLRTNKRTQYRIETKGELPYKSGDIIRFGLSDLRRYTIISIDYVIDGRNEEEYITKTSAWPGLVEDKAKIKLITLE